MDIPELNQLQEFEIDSVTREKTMKQLKNTFPGVFKSEIGKINNYASNLLLNEKTSSFYKPACAVLYALRDKVDAESIFSKS